MPARDSVQRWGGLTVLGTILVLVGAGWFVLRELRIDPFEAIADAGWPFFVIIPGVVLLVASLVRTPPNGVGLAIAGSIVTTVGAVLFYQQTSGHWESWAYAWALVGPGGSGIGLLLYGTRSGDRKMARDGFWAILTALGIFAVGLVFFEGVLGISGERLPLPEWVLPVAIIGIGILVLLRGLTFREPRAPAWSSQTDAAPPAMPADAAPDAGEPDEGSTTS